MKLVLAIIALANAVPILVGIVFYEATVAPFASEYVAYSLSFSALLLSAFVVLGRRPARRIVEMLGEDLERRGFAAFLIVIALALMAVNLGWLTEARELGPDDRGLVFKAFFVFEDVVFVAFALLLHLTLRRPRPLGFAAVISMGYVILVVFGRFGAFASCLLVLVLLHAAGERRSLRRQASLALLLGATLVATYAVEVLRMPENAGVSARARFLDRVGEVATLGVVDDIFARNSFDGFAGFENLAYLYAPSVLFPEKPAINDGADFLRENYGLGAGRDGTRFALLLHVDAFRRFGWAGLTVAAVPALMFRIVVGATYLVWSRLGVPFLALILLKHVVYLYPKTLPGVIEVGLYTHVRSSLLLIGLFLLYGLLPRPNASAPVAAKPARGGRDRGDTCGAEATPLPSAPG